MSALRLATIVFVTLLLASCSRLGTDGGANRSLLGAVSPAASTAEAISTTQLSDFIVVAALTKMSKKDKTEAASAQFYALQFGRPGAPRAWQGDSGASGKISVGPYVRVNSLDCRGFTHQVVVEGRDFERSGTACREDDGHWDVAG